MILESTISSVRKFSTLPGIICKQPRTMESNMGIRKDLLVHKEEDISSLQVQEKTIKKVKKYKDR